MGAVTYPNEKVAKFIDYNFVPVQIEISNKDLVDKFKIAWTPAIILLDTEGNETHREVGFLPPEEFIPAFIVAKGNWYLEQEQYDRAMEMYNEALQSYPYSAAAAEAVYYLGVTRYKKSHDPKRLREVYDTLIAKFPQSEWTKRAAPYRLIEP
jgi:tetratricopeptide (TPR) repeat protein